MLLLAAALFFTSTHVVAQCLPTATSLSCGNTTTFNLTSTGYVGAQPSSGATGCNPCCYPGSDLDCDGSQDVPFSVENSVWFKYCNSSGASQVISINVDEPGSGGSCNLQGAMWTGAALNSTTIACNNGNYNFFDSNAGGSADGFAFSNITVPNGQCIFVMVDGYNGNTCSNIGITVTCPCTPPTLTSSSNTSVCPNQSTTLTVSGALTYTWSPSTGLSAITGSSVTASPSTSTVYTVVGTDANGCTSSKTITVGVKAKPTVTLATTSASCGLSNGTITATPGGATSPYTYTWSNGATTQTATGLVTGTYTVTVTSANGCTNSATAIVGNTSMSLNVSSSPSTCSTSEGEASVSVSGASGPYTYLWSNGATTATINSLSNGMFYVTVTAAGGCTATASADIDGSQGPEFTLVYTPSTCNQPNGSVNVTPSNGGGNPFTYQWSNGATTEDIGGAAPGTYTVTVTRANGCTSLGTVTIGSTPPVVLSAPTTINATCGTANGSATANVQSGVAPYTYIWSNGATGATASNLAAGSYTYTVTSANGCTAVGTANISNTAAPIINSSATSSTCESANGSMSVNVVSGGISPFTYQWSNGATSLIVNGVAAGSYTVTVTDAVGCQTTKSVLVSNLASPVVALTPVLSTCGNANGGIGINLLSGNNAPLSYSWSNGATTSSLNNTAAGTYSVTVTNGTGCTVSQTTTVANIPGPTFALSPTNSTCGLNNGSVFVSGLTDGTAPFGYVWSSGATTQNILGVASGSYTLTITDANGCTASQSVTLSTTTVPALSSTTTFATCGNANGTATVSVSNGTAPFAYTWSNGSTGGTASGLGVGTYSVTVTDAAGCTAAASASITSKPSPSLSQSHVNATCGYSNGAINLSVTAVAGTSPFTYLWSNGATTQDLSSVAEGTYEVTVTNVFGCTASLIVNLPNTPAPQLQLVPNTATCGNANGSVNAQVIGGTSPFTYSWSTGATTQDIVNKMAGTYSVTVTDANGCTAVQSATVANTPGPTLSTTHTNTTCGFANGNAVVNATAGTAPFIYNWSNGQTTSTVSNLPGGTYSVTVTDANGCTASTSVSISNSTSPVVSLTPVSSTCGNSNGSVSASVSMGTTPFTFLWSNGATTQNISNVAAAGYTITVTDAIGCTAIASGTVSNITGPTISTTHVNATCGINNGVATVIPSGGTAPYAYVWSNGSTNPSITGLGAGSFNVTVTDANGCTATQTTSLTAATAPSITLNPVNSTCVLANGSITSVITNGTSPYTYAWSTGATVASLSNINAGSYTLTVTDFVGCTASQSVSISTSQLPVINLSPTNPSCGLSNGAITSSVSQGNTPYSFAWSNGSSTNSIAALPAGTYSITVSTADGCTSTQSISLATTVVPTLSITPTATTCGLNNGAMTASASGAASPYSFVWSNGASSAAISNLASGNYSVTVTSSNGCTASSSGSIASSVPPSLSLSTQPSTCGSANGSITSNATLGTPPYSYAWSTGATSQNLANVLSGNYSLTVTDAIGCTASQSVALNNIAGPTVTVTPVATTCGLNNGIAISTVSSGTAPFTILWSNGSTSTSISNLAANSYSLTVTDANGCTAMANATVGTSTSPSVSLSTTGSTCSYANGSIISTTTLGTAPYSYLWSNGATSQNLANVLSGSYSVTITDNVGCTSTASATVSNTPAPTLSLASSNATCGVSNGSVGSAVVGGTSPYTFSWSNGATTSTINALPAGAYSLTVTDANSCTAVQAVGVSSASAPVVSITSVNSTCGLSNGSANALVGSGTPPYTYLWNNGSTNAIINGIAAGTYSITVNDAVGCIAVQTITITTSQLPTVTLTAVNSTCEQSNGSVSANVTSGNTPYSYNWSGTQTTNAITNLPAGSYTVTVTTADGCTATQSATVFTSTIPIVSAIPTATGCGLNNGSISLSIINAPAPFTYSWSNGLTSATVTNIASGSYSVTVVSSNGCSATANATVAPSTSPTTTLNPTPASCGYANGSVNSTTTLGTTPYSYSWSNGVTTQNLTNILAGSYTLTVTDAAGCTTTQSTIVANNPTPVLSANVVNATCNLSNGNVNVTVTSGTSPFGVQWSNGATTQNIQNVSAGSYSLTVTDANNCTAQITATITNAPPPTVSASFTPSTCGLSNATVTTTANGTLPLTYLWNNAASTSNLMNVAAGSYALTITDDNGCTATTSVAVNNIPGPTATTSSTNASCGFANGDATVNISGGTSSYNILWSNGATAQSINAVAAGTYDVTITDANNCTVSTVANVSNSSGPSIASLTPTSTTCGNSNGAVASIVNGGATPLSFTWSNGATQQNISNIPAASYSLTVTDANGCQATATSVVSDIAGPIVTGSGANATCGNLNGNINLTLVNGTPGFNFSWSNGATTQNLTNLGAGSFTVTVVDGNSCTATQTINITAATAPTISLSPSNETCSNANGSITTLSANGTSPYSYNWSNGATSQNINGLTAGSYSITLTDAAGCTVSQNVGVSNEASPVFTLNTVNTTCGAANGLVEVATLMNGVSPFQYLWNNGATTVSLNNITAGSFSLTITDANGCTYSQSAILTDAPPPTLSLNAIDATCSLSNGSIATTVSGTSPFSFNWSNGSTNQNLANVAEGAYTLTVTDANGCTVVSSVTVGNAPSPGITLNAASSTCGDTNGSAASTLSGGTTPFTYSWSNGATTQSISNVAAGLYNVTVTDANNCTVAGLISIQNIQGPGAAAFPTNATCELDNGSINLSISNGTSPFTFIWSNGAITQNISSVAAGSYSVTVTDANSCTATTTQTISTTSVPAITTTPTPTTCGFDNGSITLSITNGTAPFTFSWSNGSTTQNINGLAGGTYNITVIDAIGCSSTSTAAVDVSTNPFVTLTPLQSVCSNANGSINSVVTNGVAPYIYLWSSGATTANISNIPAGSYGVTITDASGCTTESAAVVVDAPSPLLTLLPSDETCSAGNGSLTSTLNGGTSPFTYNWSNGSTDQNLVSISAGGYSLTVTDANGCTAVQTTSIANHPSPTLSLNPTASTCGATNGSIDATVFGGTNPLIYNWSNGATTIDLSNVSSGSYSLTITDANGCSVSQTSIITDDAAPVLTLVSTATSCGLSNGDVQSNVSGGLSPYQFSWSNGTTTADISNLSTGDFDLTVIDANGCQAIATANVAASSAPAITLSVVDATCNNSNGTVSSSILNGISPYTYLWSNGETSQNISGIAAGSYSLTVTDAVGCTASLNATVNDTPPVSFTLTPTNPSCGNANGDIQLLGIIGTSPFNFNWSNGSTTQNLGSLDVGSYAVTVTDAAGCLDSQVVLLTTTLPPTVTTGIIVDANCNQSNGSAQAIINGDVSPYAFNWSNGNTAQNLTNVTAGSYVLTVTDAMGCTAVGSFVIANTSGPAVTANATESTCGNANGLVEAIVTDGTAPFNYQWSNGATDQNVSNLVAGNYSVTVTDAAGCQAIASTTVVNIAGPSLSVNVINSTCGYTNGSAEVIASNGTTPYQYFWSTGETNALIDSIAAGTYNVTITDSNGCTASAGAVVSTTSLPIVDLNATNTTCGDDNGFINAIVVSGNSPMQFEWSTGETNATLANLSTGSYTLTVTDSFGCTTNESVDVIALSLPAIAEVHQDATCGLANGSIDLTATSGQTPYNYTWSTGETTEDLSNIQSGNYTVTLTDANGCATTTDVLINDTPLPQLSGVAMNSSCAQANGSYDLAVNGIAPFEFAWSNGSTNADLSSVGSGSYSVTVTDANACTATLMISIVDDAAPQLSIVVLNNATCNLPNANATVNITGGLPPYNAIWSNGTTGVDLVNVGAGTYAVTITDANSCVATEVVTLTNSTPPTATGTVVDETCNADNGAIDITVNGISPFSYTWSNGGTTEDLSLISSGSYSVTITDVNNCTVDLSIVVNELVPVAISLTPTHTQCNLQNGAIALSIISGATPITFEWSNGASSQSLTGIDFGQYSVTATDANGCTTAQSDNVNPSTNPSISFSVADASCGNSNGSIDLTASSGIAPYSFMWSNGSTDEDVDSIVAGTYNVTVTDVSGCTIAQTINVTNIGAPVISTNITNATCELDNGSVELIVTGGVAQYQYAWSNGATTQNIDSLFAGTYQLTVTDSSNCSAIQSATITTTANPVASVTTQNATCGFQNGLVDVTVSGNSPFNFVWSNGDTTEDIASLAAGNYDITIADSIGCTTTVNTSISNIPGPALTITSTNTTCGFDNGTIDLTINNGMAPFTIAWTNGNTNEDLSNLTNGGYDVTVTDSFGCVAAASVNILSSTPIDVSTVVQDAACGQSNGNVFTTITNATSPFVYTWSNSATTADLTNVTAGSYTVTVFDANNCSAVQTINVSNANGPQLTFTASMSTCGNANGLVDATTTGGLAPYVFVWSNGATIEDLSNVAAGNYSITVSDANNCQAVGSVILSNIAGPSLQSTFTAVTCGNANGAINLTVTNGTAPYTYSWSNGATTEDLANISSGTYIVTVVDANGCSATHSRNVTGTPAPMLSLSIANASCGLNGAVAANASGGLPPFQFVWSTGAFTSSITGLAPGVYNVTVTSANGCSNTATATVAGTLPPTINATATDASCGNANGSIMLALGVAPSPFVFQWSSGATTQDISALIPGTYNVTATSSNGCSVSTQATVNGSASLSLSIAATNASCNQTNGTASATVAGSSLQFTWNNGATTQNINGLSSANYVLTVIDATGCSAVDSVMVGIDPCAPMLSLQVTNASCGAANGLVEATVNGGTAPYSYLWNNGSTLDNIANAAPGNYSVTITDANGMTVSGVATVVGTAAVTTNLIASNATCGVNNGAINLSVLTGQAPFTFIWNNGATTQNISNASVGTYVVTVTSADGCITIDTAVVNNLNGPQVSLLSSNATCTQANGLVDATISNGTLPYTYSWSNGFTGEDLSNVVAGSYTIAVTDANNCQAVATANVGTNNGSLSILTTNINATCGNANGAISIVVNNGTSPFTYSWSSGVTSQNLTNVNAGIYSVTTSDANGCTASATDTIVNSATPTITFSITNETCSNANGSIDINIANGTQPFAFSWSNGFTTEDINNLSAGSYIITVTDNIGCTAIQSITITNAAAPTLSTNSVNANCGTSNGSISLVVSNGTNPFTYDWSNGATTQNISNIGANVYNVTVNDANGCTVVATATVLANGAPVLSYTSVPSGCTVNNGSINLTTTGGVAPYNFVWSNGATLEDLSNVGIGIYNVTVTDATNCSVVLSADVSSTNPPALNVFPIDATCGNNNGSITTQANGLTPFTYEWSNAATTQDIQNLQQGFYSVTATDANGCSVSLSANIGNSSGPSVTIASTISEACGQSNGSVDIDVNGGALPYSFFWNNGATSEDVTNLISGSYNVVVVDNNGCTVSQDVAVGFIDGPQGFVNTMPEMCGGDNGLVDLTVVGGTQPYNFIWSNGASTEDISNLVGGSYDVIVVDSNNCVFQSSAAVIIVPYFNIQLSAVPDTVCSGAQVNVTASNCAAYNWSPSIGLNNTTGSTNFATVTSAMTYTVIGTDLNGCTSQATFNVQPAPLTTAATDGGPYAGCPPYDCILLSNNTNSIGTQWWVDGELVSTSDGALLTLGTGIYDVELIAVSSYGCNDTLALPTYIEVYDVPQAEFEMEQTNDVNGEFEFTNLSTGGNSFAWNFGDGSVDSTYSPLHQYAIPANYTVTLITTNEDGCSDTTARTMPADWPLNVFIPNTFTPNGDGVNDYFTLFGDGFKRFHLRVYDRWGEKVFDTDEGILTWDGNFKNKPLNTAVFVYIADIELLDGFSMRRYGDVTLLR